MPALMIYLRSCYFFLPPNSGHISETTKPTGGWNTSVGSVVSKYDKGNPLKLLLSFLWHPRELILHSQNHYKQIREYFFHTFFRIIVLAHLTYLHWPFKVKLFWQFMTTEDHNRSSEVVSCQKKLDLERSLHVGEIGLGPPFQEKTRSFY